MPENNVSKPDPGKLKQLVLHLHPKFIPERALQFSRTFGLGGMAALLFVIQAVTGILLRFYYIPTPNEAYDSILFIQQSLLFGNFIRNIHHWSGMLLVVITFMHLLRVFLTGSYSNKRGKNWIIGVCLLLLVIALNFTGYLLPWDQLSYWAITVSTSTLKYFPVIGEQLFRVAVRGSEVGAPTLISFYNFHTGLLPFVMIVLMSLHFWKVRKNGGILLPKTSDPKDRHLPVIPHLVLREFVAALVLLAVVIGLSTFINAPLADRANPVVTPNPTKAPWYFMGFQEMLLHFHPIISIVILPLSMLLLLFYLPKLNKEAAEGGVWFLSAKGKTLALWSGISGIIVSIIFTLLSEFVLKNMTLFKNGIVSFFLYILALLIGIWFLKHRKQFTRGEIIQTAGVFLLVCFLIMTITGIFFRGEGMQLIF